MKLKQNRDWSSALAGIPWLLSNDVNNTARKVLVLCLQVI